MGLDQHALLSASGADRWLHCPPSARLTQYMPDTYSEYAEEGKLAHAIAELYLRKKYTDPMGPQKFKNALKKLRTSQYYKHEMDGYVAGYVDYVESAATACPHVPFVAIEARVDFGLYVPGGFGTCDAVILDDDMLHVIDLKYGKGVPVSPENNPQIMLYGLGAMFDYDILDAVKRVKLTIAQPRLDAWSEWEITADVLRDWGDAVVKPLAARAMAGQGEYHAGAWCRWCKAKDRCTTRSDTMALEGFPTFATGLISNAELAKRIEVITPYVEILNDLKALALAECLAGRVVPGFKAVEGRSNRVFTDVGAAFDAAIRAGYDEAKLYKREPITLTAAEKLLGKDFNNVMGAYVDKPTGKPALVPASDKRDAITDMISIEEAFSDMPPPSSEMANLFSETAESYTDDLLF